MGYTRTDNWNESQQGLEKVAGQFNNLGSSVQQAYERLVILKADRLAMYDADQLLPAEEQKYTPGMVAPNAKMAATYGPTEDVTELHIDEAEAAILALKAAFDGADMDAIVKFA